MFSISFNGLTLSNIYIYKQNIYLVLYNKFCEMLSIEINKWIIMQFVHFFLNFFLYIKTQNTVGVYHFEKFNTFSRIQKYIKRIHYYGKSGGHREIEIADLLCEKCKNPTSCTKYVNIGQSYHVDDWI